MPERNLQCATSVGLLAALLAILTGCGSDDGPSAAQYDLLIVNGSVYAGGNEPPRKSNIGVIGDRIASIDAPADAPAELVIDATGLAVMPGFIDPHTHALEDLKSATGNANANFLMQGVTTVFVGNDGGGMPDLSETLGLLRAQGMGTSAAFYAGHGNIRQMVMGLENREPAEGELGQMRELVDAQMRAGALGLSTGLYYTPGSFATTEEVIELAKVAARYGGVYDSHMRDESSYSIGLVGAVEEVIAIAEQANLPGHIAHLKALGRDVWGQSGDIIALVDEARRRGVDVTADQYPYPASGTSLESSLIPAWVRADSDEAMFERISNPDLASGIREEMEANLWRRGGAETLLVTGPDSRWRGMTLQQIAEEMGVDPIEAAVAVVREGDPSIASFNMDLPDIHAFAIQDWVMTGSDGSEGHPRKYGTYPTVYREMVLGAQLFPVERFVHRSSGRVADFAGLCDRGYLEEGRKADIVVIDLANYRPRADFTNPTALAEGVVHALVNGRFAIRDGGLTGELPGEVVDRQNLACPD
ncbi:MAG: amidohydrolase family protein [Gammaproteobacteria bacterium]|nr:amidohydrolase family protein [Gammaproteobacteria bacterium]MDH4254547.1 amidohydrolase family protein [Gammaproteobacteria bacterium]MDH5310397.1 amidohydrolase family protein [Gammaproteobacteria bacterium]